MADKRLILLGYNNIVATLIERMALPANSIEVVSSDGQLKGKSVPGSARTTQLDDQQLTDYLLELKVRTKDLVISIGCPWILKEEHIHALGARVLNLHGTHLPTYRGGTIYSWYILARKRTGLCALHRMTEQLDQGGITHWEEYLIPPGCRKPAHLMELYAQKNSAFLEKIIRDWYASGIHPAANGPTQQPEYLSSYWPRLLTDHHGWLDWSWKGEDLEAFACAFDDPYKGVQTEWRGKVVRLKDVYFQPGMGSYHPFQYGQIFRKSEQWIHVAVQGGELIIERLLDEYEQDFFKQIRVGDRLYTRPEKLVNQNTRVYKGADGLKAEKFW